VNDSLVLHLADLAVIHQTYLVSGGHHA
jgi:hypothetical protein